MLEMRLPLLLIIQISLAAGHGDLHEQIKRVSAKITETPDDPKLWLTRADLYQSHRNPELAHLDLLHATRLKPLYPPAFLELAQFDRKRGKTESAQKSLTRYLTLVSTSNRDPLAYREKALLSPPVDALEPWRTFLRSDASPTMRDYALAAQSALEASDLKATREFLHAGLNLYPKTIELHQLRARLALTEDQKETASASFKTLRLLYPNLLVKLNYEESLIWGQFKESKRANQALLSALHAYQQLPNRLQKNRDLLALAAKIKNSLRK